MGDSQLVTLEDLDKSYLKNNIKKEKPFKIKKHGIEVVESKELIDWIIETQSKEDIRKLVIMIKVIKKRNMPIRPLLYTIAIGLFNKYK